VPSSSPSSPSAGSDSGGNGLPSPPRSSWLQPWSHCSHFPTAPSDGDEQAPKDGGEQAPKDGGDIDKSTQPPQDDFMVGDLHVPLQILPDCSGTTSILGRLHGPVHPSLLLLDTSTESHEADAACVWNAPTRGGASDPVLYPVLRPGAHLWPGPSDQCLRRHIDGSTASRLFQQWGLYRWIHCWGRMGRCTCSHRPGCGCSVQGRGVHDPSQSSGVHTGVDPVGSQTFLVANHHGWPASM
jgi:hypothetical protein